MTSVLLVDDDGINNLISVKLIRRILADAEISYCLDGAQAIRWLLENCGDEPDRLPDYILLDINMPVMNGWEFLEEYMRLGITTPGKCIIYMLSSSIFVNDMNKARSYPVVRDFISKPLDDDKIRAILYG